MNKGDNAATNGATKEAASIEVRGQRTVSSVSFPPVEDRHTTKKTFSENETEWR